MNSYTTKKGTVLPLINLKGKPYLQVAQRLVWLNEECKNFEITTEFLALTEDYTIAKATLKILDESGKVVRMAQATKRETKKDFSDHTEKAETAAIGRAAAIAGFGTQFTIADMDEGARLADSPVEIPQRASEPQKVTTFRKPSVVPQPAPKVANSSNDDWE